MKPEDVYRAPRAGGDSEYPVPGATSSADELVSGLAAKSLLFGVLGLLCCGLLFGPLAISYANRAEAALITHDASDRHRTLIKVGRIVGYASIVVWVIGSVVRLAELIGR